MKIKFVILLIYKFTMGDLKNNNLESFRREVK